MVLRQLHGDIENTLSAEIWVQEDTLSIYVEIVFKELLTYCNVT